MLSSSHPSTLPSVFWYIYYTTTELTTQQGVNSPTTAFTTEFPAQLPCSYTTTLLLHINPVPYTTPQTQRELSSASSAADAREHSGQLESTDDSALCVVPVPER